CAGPAGGTKAVGSSVDGSPATLDDLAIGQALQVPVVATWKHGRDGSRGGRAVGRVAAHARITP
ncbi:MAG TPA: hypothetical protein VIJ60_08670, partial [Acidimicrobiales bacterium]